MLGHLQALSVWAERSQPSDALYRMVAEWVLDLEADPWQPPSVPWGLNEGEPYEIRLAELHPVVIFYTVDHESLDVQIMGIVDDAPPPNWS